MNKMNKYFFKKIYAVALVVWELNYAELEIINN